MQNIYQIVKLYKQNLLNIGELKDHLRISHNSDDKLLENLSLAAIDAAEKFTGLCLYERDIKLTTKNYAKNGVIKLKYQPVAKIINIAAYNSLQQESNISPEDYYLDSNLGELHFVRYIDPELKLIIKYKAGFDEDNIPYLIKQGIIEHIADMYDSAENRGGILSESIRGFYLPYRFLRI